MLPEPYYETENGKLYHGDCLDIMREMDDNSVDLVLTDPPYGMKNNVDSSRFSGGLLGHIAKCGNGGRFKHPIIGDDKPFNPAPFLDYPHVILWGSNHYSNVLPRGTTLIWIKKLDSAFGTFLSDAEIAWMKGGHGIYCYRDLSLLKETRFRQHPNQKPISLMGWCLDKSKSHGIVLDPFLGSGTTAVACERLNRRWIGIEISKEYCDIAVERIRREVAQPKLAI